MRPPSRLRERRLMGMTTAIRTARLIPGLFLFPLAAFGQGSQADYERAFGLTERFAGLLVNAPEQPSWIGETSRLWYRKSVLGGNEFVLVDAATLEKRAAFDHQRVASALAVARDTVYTAITLPFSAIEFVDAEAAIEFTTADSIWRCDLANYECQSLRPAPPRRRGFSGGPREESDEPRISPDGLWEAFIRNYNVHVRRVGSEEAMVLSMDGSEGDYYELQSIQWSPDSKQLAAYRVKPGHRRIVRYVESSPEDQLQPKYMEREYAKPGDVLDVQQPVLFHIDPKAEFVVENTLFPNAYRNSQLVWREDSRAFTFEYNQRGHQVYRVIEVDAASGTARAVISEEPKTFFYYRDANGNQRDSGKKFRYDLDDGREVIWMSERDGWSHLYLYDGVTGVVKHQITRGNWVVRNVEWVDEENRQVWFRASGMYPGKDPYFLHYYRIDFDGTGLRALTEADGDHSVSFSADRQYYVDVWSRVDLAPIAQLRRTGDQELLLELERGDDSALLQAGWRPPEVFTAKGRDGRTDIWGVIFRPTNFDPAMTYPVIENIYAGPQGSFVPKTFSVNSSMRAQSELGFIVVQMDGMGTNNRSKAFHDVAWKNLGDAGLPDRILWHKAVAARYPYYDISRVGIYGTSAGGQSSLGGLLFHPDFYKAAVSAVGCHDNRMDKIWWNELWMSWPLGPQYDASSNVVNAHLLQGQLLLVVGELDTNVDPSSTLQVANALIEADKSFDLLFIPGAGHGSGGRYGERKRFDFFVQHLLGVAPPDWNGGVKLSSYEESFD
jgi:dipeptidyl aminopeptidase/acylaminoacyl peptidase